MTSFLSNCMDPPALVAIQRTLKFLRDIQALRPVTALADDIDSSATFYTSKMPRKQQKRFMDSTIKSGMTKIASTSSDGGCEAGSDDNDVLTPLGYHIANLPMDPQCAKLLILGALFCCLEPVLAVAACLAFKDPFEVPIEHVNSADARRAELAGDSLSDHWVYFTVLSVSRSNPQYFGQVHALNVFAPDYALLILVIVVAGCRLSACQQFLFKMTAINLPIKKPISKFMLS